MSVKVFLSEKEIPRQWYNLNADMPPKYPLLGLDKKLATPEWLGTMFPMNLLAQSISTDRWIDIPEEVLELLYRWRPTPLHRAVYLEKALGTPARIYYKNEGVSPPGSHKPNTAVPQAWYAKQFGVKKLTTETGAGQWGSALALACTLVGLECKVYMVRISYDQKPYRKSMMQAWGATCIASPSTETQSGRDILAQDPDSPGSLGIAISEAIEEAVSDKSGKTKYSLGSVLPHVLLHQTIIGLEAKKQLEKFGEKKVDVVIGCAGGGSNFAGLSFPFVFDKIHGAQIDIIPVEPCSCPTMTKAPFVYDYGDTAKVAPIAPMHSLGHTFVPPPIHAGGLRYHGIAPQLSQAILQGLITPKAVHQLECFEASVLFARTEGIIPAPETGHAIAVTIQEARKAKEEGKEKVILFNMSGHGLMDLRGYELYFRGELSDYAHPEEEIHKALEQIKDLPKPDEVLAGMKQ
jgi:tryptophan synthase beta chain